MGLFRILIVWIVFSGFYVGIAYANPPEELSLKTAVSMAIAENPQFKARQMDFEIGQGDVLTAGLLDNPTLYSDSGIAEKTYRIGIRQVLPLGHRRRHQIGLTLAQLDVTQAGIDAAGFALKKEVRKVYTRLYLLQQRQQMFQEVDRNLKELAALSNLKSKTDQAQLELYHLQILNRMQVLNVDMFQARSRLNTLLNRPLTQQWVLSPPPALISLEGWLDVLVQEALSHRPEIRQKRAEMNVARAEITLAKSKRVPDLTLTVGPDWLTQPSQRAVGAFFTTSMEIPMFNRHQGQIQKAQAQLERYRQLIRSKSKELLELVKKELKSGESELEEALNAQSTDVDIALEHLNAIQDYQDAISELEGAVGKNLDD